LPAAAPLALLARKAWQPTLTLTQLNEAISVSHLRKNYGALIAVADVSFEVERGQIFGIIGPNGSGKTTTVECLQGLRKPDAGELRVLGLDPATESGTLRRRIGSQLQKAALPDRLRVWEALDLFASLAPRPVDSQLFMEQWGLTSRRNSAFADLSGGERQRLFVALALVNSPELVFLDEMTTGLDPAARRIAWDLIRAIREQGATVVLVTHFMDEAEQLCDTVAVFRQGRILALDSPAALIASYAGASVVTFTAGDEDVSWLEKAPFVSHMQRRGSHVEVHGAGPLLAYTAAALVEHGLAPLDLQVKRSTLEDVFLNLTGSAPGGEQAQ